MKRSLLGLLYVLVCLGPAWSQTAEQRQATVNYLRDLQAGDGGFYPAAPRPASAAPTVTSLRATSSALRALKYFGGEPRDRPGCVQYVESCFDKASGGFVDHPRGKPDVTTTAVGIMAVVELKMDTRTYVPKVLKYLCDNSRTFEDIRIAAAGLEAIGQRPSQADAWLKQIAALRNPDGTYGKGDGTARETGSAAVIVLRLGDKVEHEANVLKALKAGQRADGAFGKEGVPGSDLETSYRVLRAFKMLNERPAQVERLQEFIAKCRNADGGYGIAPGQPSAVSSTYFASIILHWLSEK